MRRRSRSNESISSTWLYRGRKNNLRQTPRHVTCDCIVTQRCVCMRVLRASCLHTKILSFLFKNACTYLLESPFSPSKDSSACKTIHEIYVTHMELDSSFIARSHEVTAHMTYMHAYTAFTSSSYDGFVRIFAVFLHAQCLVVHMHTYMRVQVYVHGYVHTSVQPYVCMNTHTHVYKYTRYTYTGVDTYIHVYIHI
jgi:hypothetical protein